MGHEAPKAKRILEINPDHAVIRKMSGLDAESKKLWCELLHKQALLNEGSPLPDPAQFSKLLTQLMLG
jgi:molecular chaperone HtpG